MFVYVAFKLAPSGTRWRVPATAVIFDAQGSRVAIVGTNNTIHFQNVEIGRDFGEAFDIQAGLQGQERIVLPPTVALQEGQVVKPIASGSTSTTGSTPGQGGPPPPPPPPSASAPVSGAGRS